MSLRRKSGSPYWHYRFKLKGREFHRSTKCTPKRAAQRVEDRARAAARAALDAPDSTVNMTLNEATGVYWRRVEHKSDAKNIEMHLDTWLAELGKTTRVKALTNADIAAAIARLRAKRSDATVNRYTVHLRAALNYAADAYDAAVPRFNWRAHMLREPDERDRWLRTDELPKLLAAAAPHLRPLIFFAVLTGIRLANQALRTKGGQKADTFPVFVLRSH